MRFEEPQPAERLQDSIDGYNNNPNKCSYSATADYEAVLRVAGKIVFLFTIMAALAWANA